METLTDVSLKNYDCEQEESHCQHVSSELCSDSEAAVINFLDGDLT